MIYIFIFFLGIYIVLIGLTLRYAQAFKTKNKIIDIIEQYDGLVYDDDGSSPVLDAIVDQLLVVNLTPDDIEISLNNNDGDRRKTCYYKVTSFITWEGPFLGLEGKWKITGESKNVKKCQVITIPRDEF